jgi:nitrogen fixation protein NifU and related proteins
MSSGVETSLTALPNYNKRFLDFARNDKDVYPHGAPWQKPMSDDLESKIEEAIKHPQNLGEMKDADAIGTVGSADCGDMLRMWIKFKEQDGRKIIDRATFQSFGCQTAIAVASVATEMLKGKTAEEAKSMSGEELSGALGPLPPVKIHCAQLVEGALRNALGAETSQTTEARSTSPTLAEQLSAATQPAKVKVVFDK